MIQILLAPGGSTATSTYELKCRAAYNTRLLLWAYAYQPLPALAFTTGLCRSTKDLPFQLRMSEAHCHLQVSPPLAWRSLDIVEPHFRGYQTTENGGNVMIKKLTITLLWPENSTRGPHPKLISHSRRGNPDNLRATHARAHARAHTDTV